MNDEAQAARSEPGAGDYLMRVAASIDTIDAAQWNALRPRPLPFLDHRFLSALESSRSVGRGTGWMPMHLVLEKDGQLVGACPCYRKTHSYGEYVFDWAWANAYERHGLPYYPKGLVGVPFTPVPGARLLARDPQALRVLASALPAVARQMEWSSMHVLFPDSDDEALALTEAGFLERQGVQFHWHNPGFGTFDDYLASLIQSKRKKVRAERRKVAQAGVTVRAIAGGDLGPQDWDFFYRCYAQTYAEHHSTPYLARAFFDTVGHAMPEHIVMFVAERADGAARRPIAASLLFHDDEAIYGRHWGAVEHVPLLHFETSYYAPIEWAIARGMKRFEGGAQGEHKMARGFLPAPTRSLHWLAHPAFNDAVAEFLERETAGVDAYIDELNDRSPMRRSVHGAQEAPGTHNTANTANTPDA